MKKVVLGMFIAAVTSQAAGCIFVSDDDDDGFTDGEEAVIDVGWTFLEVDAAGNTAQTPCPPGGTIDVHTQEVDSAGNPIGTEIIDQYNCDIGNAVTPPLPPGRVSVFLVGTSGAATFTSFTQFVDLTTQNQVVDFDLISNGGYIQFAWNLVGATTGAPLDCADVPELDGIGNVVTVADTPTQSFDFQYDCVDGFGTSDPLVTENYVVSIDAFDASNASISETFTQNVSVGDLNDIVELGTIEIPILGL